MNHFNSDKNINQIDFLKSLFASMEENLNFCVFDGTGKYISISPQFKDYFFDENYILQSQTVQSLGSDQYQAEFWNQFLNTLKAGESWRGEIIRKDKNNNEFITFTIASPLVLPLETPLTAESSNKGLFLEFHQDITKMKSFGLQIDNQSKVALASARFALIGQMLGGITHEINNPLTIILGTAKFLKMASERGEVNTEVISKGSDKIVEAVNRIVKINKVIKFISRDSSKDAFSSSSVKGICSEVNLFIGARIKNHGVHFEISEDSDDYFINCRPSEIIIALLNLILNSDTAVRESQNPWIKLNYESDGKELIFRVTDSGRGVSSKIKRTMVRPFVTSKELGSGMGLGLSVVKDIAENHSGRFYYDEESINTSFIFRIPLML